MIILKKFKSIVTILVFSFIICCVINYTAQNALQASNTAFNNYYTFVIDAGHGGKDAGTIANDGTLEKNINLDISKSLYDYLRVMGINCKMIRNGDYEFYRQGEERNRSDLYNRLDYVNSVNNSALISIHQNHFEDTREWGMQVFFSPNDEKSNKLADCIQNKNKTFLQPDNQRITKKSTDSLYILYKASVPSVMVECGFMSNYEENEKLKNKEYQNKLAYIITLGIFEWGVQIGK